MMKKIVLTAIAASTFALAGCGETKTEEGATAETSAAAPEASSDAGTATDAVTATDAGTATDATTSGGSVKP